MTPFSKIKIKFKILIVMTLIIAITSIAFSFISLKSKKESLLTTIDSKLIAVARIAKYILPENYHDKIIDRNSVSKEDYLKMIDRYNRLCLELGLEYIWSLMVIDDQIVFTSSTSTDKKVENGKHALFFDAHSNPEAYKKAFETMEIDHRINDNEWGYTRVVLAPSYDSKGRRYLFGASMKICDVDLIVKKTLMNSLMISVVIFLLGILFSFILSNSLSNPIVKLTKIAESIAGGNLKQNIDVRGSSELESLSESLDFMSKVISEKIAEMNYKNEELEKINDAMKLEIENRKRMESSLRESERQVRLLLDSTAEGIYGLDTNGSCTFANPACLQFLGYKSTEDLIGQNIHALIHHTRPDGKPYPAEECRICEAIKTKKGVHVDDEILWRADGTSFPAEYRSYPIFREDKVIGSVVTFLDISEKKRAEEALRQSEEKFRDLFNNAWDTIFICEREGLFLEVNQIACDRYGYSREEFLQITLKDLDTPDHSKRLSERTKAIVQKGHHIFETLHITKDKRTIPVEISGRAIDYKGQPAIISIVRDITYRKNVEVEKKKLEAQLQQAQKMESIGTLAGGIAHDFNNILSIILGNTELAIDDVPEWSPARLNLEEVQAASIRAKDVVRQLLSFARKTEYERKPIRVAPIIKEFLKLLRSSIPSIIDIRQNIPKAVDTILADPTQINQVMINLCANAAHAMEKEGGILEISLENVILDDSTAHLHDLFPGRFVKMSISDTAQGIPPDNINRIFDPFFTTKEVGKGVGLGLAVVHGIVMNHGGAITVDSEYEKGTKFSIFFPVVEMKPALEIPIDEDLPTGKEMILFVDDEESIIKMGRQRLERLGYKVEAKTCPLEALELFRSMPDNFDLVITDMTMPKMTGDQLAKEILNIRSDIPIILCTGFSEKISEEKAKGIGVRQYIEKPLNKHDLAVAIRKVLDGN